LVKESCVREFLPDQYTPGVPALNRRMWHILEEQIRKWKDQELLIAAPIIRPDYRTIGSNKVGRVIVGHQAVTFGGIRAEVSNQINE